MLDVQGSGREWFRWRIASFLGSLDEETLVGDRPNRILAPGRLGQPMSRRGSHLKDSLQKAAFRNMEWSSGVPPQKLLFFLATHCSSISAPSISKPHHRGSLRVFEMCPRFLPHQSMAPRVTLQPRCITMLAGARPQQRQDALTVASRLADASLGSAITDKPDMEV